MNKITPVECIHQEQFNEMIIGVSSSTSDVERNLLNRKDSIIRIIESHKKVMLKILDKVDELENKIIKKKITSCVIM